MNMVHFIDHIRFSMIEVLLLFERRELNVYVDDCCYCDSRTDRPTALSTPAILTGHTHEYVQLSKYVSHNVWMLCMLRLIIMLEVAI